MTNHMEQPIATEPFAAIGADTPTPGWPGNRGQWPADWIGRSGGVSPVPSVTAYCLRFAVADATRARLHVSADEWCELYLDGELLGRSPDLGDHSCQYFDTYAVDLAPGEHVLAARVFALGRLAPAPVVSTHADRFLLCPDPDSPLVPLLATGVAPWQYKPIDGFDVLCEPYYAYSAAGDSVVDGARYDWDFVSGGGAGWAPAAKHGRARSSAPRWTSLALAPRTLPPMMSAPRGLGRLLHVAEVASADTRAVAFDPARHLPSEAPAWQRLGDGASLDVPPHTRRLALYDLDDYVCAYTMVTVRAGRGATVRVRWAEGLRTRPYDPAEKEADWRFKPPRNQYANCYFRGLGDTFGLPGANPARSAESYWWRAGRFVEVTVETGDEPLRIEHLALRETRYPLESEGRFSTSGNLTDLFPFSIRALQMCAHSAYMDCPHYEQVQWVGDMRPQILCNYVLTRDDRLPRKAIGFAARSAYAGGLTLAFYPARGPLVLPTFSLWLVATLHDYALWRRNPEFVAAMMPTMRHNVELVLGNRGADGLARFFGNAWNFCDWVEGWEMGVPPTSADGVSALFNWQLVWVLGQLADLERIAGEPLLAQRADAIATDLAKRCIAAFWDEARGAMADDPAHTAFSEHTQSLAILSGRLDPERERLAGDALEHGARGGLRERDFGEGLAPCSTFYSHYAFEALGRQGRIEALLRRLDLWHGMLKLDLRTTPEVGVPGTRSDCHAWSAHPVYHAYATILGIRPASPGFASVRIRPQLGSLEWIKATLVHPGGGEIRAALKRKPEGSGLSGEIALPEGLTGVLVGPDGREHALRPGSQKIDV